MSRTDYDRAVAAVNTVLKEGRITLPADEIGRSQEQQISDLAEFFQVALGTNEE